MSQDPKSSYYDAGGIEAIEAIRAKLTPEQFIGYCLGNALKYGMRLNFKSPKARGRDAEKAKMYNDWLVEALSKETADG